MSNGPTAGPSEGSEPQRVRAGVVATRALTGGDAAAEGSEARHLSRGTLIGRHVILDQLGVGGMGIVYVAYDPELDRKLALKLLRPDATSPARRARLLREAQALARLSHPNVVAIHDVGTVDDQVWLAMELVQGQTLGSWLETPRRWQEVVKVMREAGEGLAAAHAAGLLHRDFKPENVMVGDDGRVRVMDFGLARAASRDTLDSREPETDASGPRGAAVQVSKTGAIVGTPAYMAPEQFAGDGLTAAADQFAFCVSLWEALYGKRPFAGKSPSELAAQVIAGRRRSPPKDRRVPSWLRRACERGLSPEPAQRWPSMSALLEALARDPAARRRRWLYGALGVAVIAGTGVGWSAWATARAQRCSGAEARLAGTWDAERRAEVEAAMRGVDAVYAARAWERAAGELDRYAADWAAMHTETCEATTIRGEQSSEVMDLRMACLHRASVELRAVVDLLADADAEVVRSAHVVTGGLRRLSTCADVDALAAGVEPPAPEDAETVEAVRQRLEQARVATQAARYTQSRARLDDAEALLGEVRYGPVRAELALVEGGLLVELGDYAAAEAAFGRALELASEARQWDAMLRAAVSAMMVVGDRLHRPGEALRYRELALGLAAKAEPWARAEVHQVLGFALYQAGRFEAAEAEIRTAMTWLEKAGEAEAPSMASALNGLGNLLAEQGRFVEAEAEHRRALALWERALGPDHPASAQAISNIAGDLHGQGKLAEAEAEQRRALALQVRALGAEHPVVATSYDNLANYLAMQGRFAEAEAEHRRALELRLRLLEPEHPEVARSHHNVAAGLHQQDRFVEAEAEYRRALAIRERVLEPDHPDIASTRYGLAAVLWELHRPLEALPHAERAWERLQRDGVPPLLRADAALLLGFALWDAHEDPPARTRARELVRTALEAYTGAGIAESAEQARTWLAEHEEPPR